MRPTSIASKWNTAYIPVAREVAIEPLDNLAGTDTAWIVDNPNAGADANRVAAIERREFRWHPAHQEPESFDLVRPGGSGGSAHDLLPHLLRLTTLLAPRTGPIIWENRVISTK